MQPKAKKWAGPKKARFQRPKNTEPINPDYVYRYIDGSLYFGLSLTQLDEKIRSGEVPPPVALSDSGHARGWFGRTILAWQREREEKAKAAHAARMALTAKTEGAR